jgi:hypothetical protein
MFLFQNEQFFFGQSTDLQTQPNRDGSNHLNFGCNPRVGPQSTCLVLFQFLPEPGILGEILIRGLQCDGGDGNDDYY